MRTEKFAGYEVPVLEREYVLPKGLIIPPQRVGRYDNWEQDPELVVASKVGDAERVRWMLDRNRGARARYSDDGFQTYLDKRGRRHELKPVRGGDIVTYVTCPSINVAAGQATAASVSIQVLPSAVSPLFAGAGGATGGQGGFWYPGRTIQYTMFGSGTTSTAPGSTIFQANIATSQNVTTGNVLGNVTTSIALAASQTNISWTINGWATCRTVGTAGTIIGMSMISLGALATTNVLNLQPANTPATVTLDTTANSAINYLLTLGATTVSFTVQMVIWQVMN
jgi:hypothetical protein